MPGCRPAQLPSRRPAAPQIARQVEVDQAALEAKFPVVKGQVMVNSFASEEALKKAKEIVSDIAKNGPLGVMMSKQAINRGLDQSRFNGFLGEGDLAHMLNFSEDRAEGLTAFRERRQAKFKGQ